MAEYENKLSDWNRANETRAQSDAKRIELEAQLAEIAAEKPWAPGFTVRQWSTIDERYKTQATLVSTDNVTAELRKTDGQSIKVPKATLIAEDRVYIDKAFAALQTYRDKLKQWEALGAETKEQLTLVSASIALAESPKPLAPEKQQVIDEIKAEDEKQAERERIAESRKWEANFDQFATWVRETDPDGLLLGGLSGKGDRMKISVRSAWHYLPYQERLQMAQGLWEKWAKIHSPRELDKAWITLVDGRGNEVGGSRFLAGSLLWVSED